MKITYNKNPLYTVIELDEREKQELWYKIKLDEYEDIIYGAYFALTHHEWHNANITKSKPRTLEETMDEAVKELDPAYWCVEGKSKLDERVDELLMHYLDELRGPHIGDCTCIPCSCMKCYAEQLLGINTIEGLEKHQAHNIWVAFGKENEKTIDEALEYLRTYEPGPFIDKGIPHWTKADHDHHAPRWKAEAQKAYDWLLNYKSKFSNAIIEFNLS